MYTDRTAWRQRIKMNKAFEKLGMIIRANKCQKCSSDIERDVYVPQFGGGKNRIKWRCSNKECPNHIWQLTIRN